MNSAAEPTYTAFEGDRRIGAGSLHDVARAARETLDRLQEASILIFDDESSAPVEIDFRGSVKDVLARIPPARVSPADEAAAAPRGPGRPRLGVVARASSMLAQRNGLAARQIGEKYATFRSFTVDGLAE